MSEAECDRLVVTRLQRVKVLMDPVTPVMWALIDEAVLRRVVGSREIMAEQITRMVRLMESGRIRAHVLPFGVGAYQLLQGMLSLMWFDDQPPPAYSEGNSVGTVHDSPALVTRLQGAYDLALSDALPLQESLALLRATAKDYRGRG